MLDKYIYDPNQAKLELLLTSNLNLIISGVHTIGKKTVIKEICTKNNLTFTVLNFSQTFNLHIETIQTRINESFHLKQQHEIILYNLEKLNFKEQKQISRYLNHKIECIHFIITTTKYQLIQQAFSKYCFLYCFKDYGKYNESILVFCKRFNINFPNKRKLFVIYIFQNLFKFTNEDIRKLLFNCIKSNFDLLMIYHKSIEFFLGHKQIHLIIQKAAMCEHLSNLGNKKMYYIEHFLFFLKYGIVHTVKSN